jgi:hypothetical protein
MGEIVVREEAGNGREDLLSVFRGVRGEPFLRGAGD